MIFFVGLNLEFDQNKVQILGKRKNTISIVHAEESRRNIMLEIQLIDGSALIAKPQLLQGGKRENINT